MVISLIVLVILLLVVVWFVKFTWIRSVLVLLLLVVSIILSYNIGLDHGGVMERTSTSRSLYYLFDELNERYKSDQPEDFAALLEKCRNEIGGVFTNSEGLVQFISEVTNE